MTDYGYCRVSTAQQDYETQRDALIAAGIEARNIVAEKITGATLVGRSLVRLIERLAPGDRLIATKLDRVGRSVRDVYNVVHQVQEAGATFKVLDMPSLDTSDPIAGKIVLNSLALTAELERYFIIQRTTEGRARAQANGVKFGRKPKLNAFQMIEAQRLRREGKNTTEIGRLFGVSHSTISRLGKTDQ